MTDTPKTCPMCGEAVPSEALACPACGENLLLAAANGGSEDSLELQDLRTFVGRRAEFYLARWRGALDGTGAKTGFNLAAFLLTGFWLPYRKMYGLTFKFYGFVFFVQILESIIDIATGGAVSDKVWNALSIGVSAWCGAHANRWYLDFTRRQIASIHAEGLSSEEYQQTLVRRGGTSLLSGFGMMFLLLVVTVGFAIMLSILNE